MSNNVVPLLDTELDRHSNIGVQAFLVIVIKFVGLECVKHSVADVFSLSLPIIGLSVPLKWIPYTLCV